LIKVKLFRVIEAIRKNEATASISDPERKERFPINLSLLPWKLKMKF
jgi:hypothetical protein